MKAAELYEHIVSTYPSGIDGNQFLPVFVAGHNLELRVRLSRIGNREINFLFNVPQTTEPRRVVKLISDGTYFDSTPKDVIPNSDFLVNETPLEPAACFTSARLIDAIIFTLLQELPATRAALRTLWNDGPT